MLLDHPKNSAIGNALPLLSCEVFGLPVYVHDDTGRLIDANTPGCNQLGYGREELLALHIWDLECGLSEAELRDVWHRLERQRDATLRGLQRRKDGSRFRAETRIHRWLREGQVLYVLLVQDITAQSAQEANLATYEQVFRELFQHAPVAMATTDEQGFLTRCNLSFCHLLGYNESELLGRQHTGLIHPDDRDASLRLTHALGHTHSSEHMVTLRYIHRGGHALSVTEHVSMWSTPGFPFHSVLMAWPSNPPPVASTPIPPPAVANDNPWPVARKITEEIVHELNQPLNSLAMFATAGLLMLKKGEVSVDKLTRSLEGLVDQAKRAERCAQQLVAFLPEPDDTGHSFSVEESARRALKLSRHRDRLRKVPLTWVPPLADVRLQGSARVFEAVTIHLADEIAALLPANEASVPGLRLSVSAGPGTDEVVVSLDAQQPINGQGTTALDQSTTWSICRTAIEAYGGKLALGISNGSPPGASVQFTWPMAACRPTGVD